MRCCILVHKKAIPFILIYPTHTLKFLCQLFFYTYKIIIYLSYHVLPSFMHTEELTLDLLLILCIYEREYGKSLTVHQYSSVWDTWYMTLLLLLVSKGKNYPNLHQIFPNHYSCFILLLRCCKDLSVNKASACILQHVSTYHIRGRHVKILNTLLQLFNLQKHVWHTAHIYNKHPVFLHSKKLKLLCILV